MKARALLRRQIQTNAKGEADVYRECRLVAVWTVEPGTCISIKNPPVRVWADDKPIGLGDIIPAGAEVWVELMQKGSVFYAPSLEVEET